MKCLDLCLIMAASVVCVAAVPEGPRPWIEVRGIYGGYPSEIRQGGRLADFGVNAIFIGSGAITDELVALVHAQDGRIFAEFNTMHVAAYVKEHLDAAPVGPNGEVCPAPHGWQGVCPTHEGYRRFRMDALGNLLTEHAIDGVWLDYHHAHASWERAVPAMPDTCFCDRCVARFAADTGLQLGDRSLRELARLIPLGPLRKQWVKWRCDVFTDWVREFREIIDATRPRALLGTFHCPWSDTDLDSALREKLAIDLKAQAAYIDVFSPMPYHARFGHADDPEWISRQVAWLGNYLGIEASAQPGERHKIWPIVQLSKWGEEVPVEQVAAVLDHGSRPPATGVMFFAWSRVSEEPEKVEAMRRFYLSITPRENP